MSNPVEVVGSDRTDVVTFGETMALMAADAPGPLSNVSALRLGLGGTESNFAVGLNRLGTSVTWLGRVGADSLGDLVLRELAGERLSLVVTRDPEAPTGLMVKERRTSDAQRVWYYRTASAGSRLCVDDLPVERITRARLLHITGITPALSSTAEEATRFAVQLAKDSGVLVSFDLNYRAALWSSDAAGPVFRSFIADADLVFAGEEEARMAVGAADTPFGLAERIAELGPTHVIIKLGARGCVALIDGVRLEQAAIPVRPIDTVGAGDAFVAGYVADFLAGASAADRLLTAVKCGAFACLVPGDWEGLPLRSELDLLDALEPVSR